MDNCKNNRRQPYEGNVFKYYSAQRDSFFDDFFVRFSQKRVLNDNRECRPRFYFDNTYNINHTLAIQYVNEHYPHCTDAVKNKLIPQIEKSINWPMRILKAYVRTLNKLGIFSLAKTQYNLHLWNNYAKDGFCVEFDFNSPFFHPRENDSIGLGELYPVIYSDNPIIFDAQKFVEHGHNDYLSIDVFYQKTPKWREEDEVRIIRFRCFADKQEDSDRVSLFMVPKDSIVAVYFSQYATSYFIDECVKKIYINLPETPVYHVTDIINQKLSRII